MAHLWRVAFAPPRGPYTLMVDNGPNRADRVERMAKRSRKRPSGPADVAVAGAGMIGLTAALAFAQAGMTVTLLDQSSPAALTDRAYDGRTTALSRASKQVLQALGVWPALAPRAEPILAVRVADGVSGAALTYDVRDLDEPPDVDGSLQGLGWIVDNRDLRLALFERIAAMTNIRLRAPATVTAFEADAAGARLALADGGEERAWLVAAADGARSTLRHLAGIATQAWGLSPGSLCLDPGP